MKLQDHASQISSQALIFAALILFAVGCASPRSGQLEDPMLSQSSAQRPQGEALPDEWVVEVGGNPWRERLGGEAPAGIAYAAFESQEETLIWEVTSPEGATLCRQRVDPHSVAICGPLRADWRYEHRLWSPMEEASSGILWLTTGRALAAELTTASALDYR